MKKILSLLLSAAMMMTIASCGGTEGESSLSGSETETSNPGITAEEIVIGGLAPLTGNVSQYGIATNNGVELAVAELNANGGILGKQIKYIVEDEQGDPTEATNAYNKLVQTDNIIALLGDVTTKPTIAVAQKAAGDGIPMITATATGAAVTEAGDNIFRACFIDPYQGQIMANFASSELKAKTAAVLYDTGDDYSNGIADAFKAEAEALGIEVLNFEGYTTGVDDFSAQLTKIKASNPDVIMVPCYYDDASKIITQARKLDITVPFLGSDGWDGVEQKLSGEALNYLVDAYYCSQYSRQSENPELQAFLKKYEETYGIPENMFAVLGYDTMMILAKAIESANSTDPEAIIAALAATSHNGLTGLTTFDEFRNPVRESYITTFEDGEPKVHMIYSIDSEK